MKTKEEQDGRFTYVSEDLVRYASGKYYARLQVNCKDVRKSLRTTDLALARRRLRDLRNDLEQTEAVASRSRFGNFVTAI